MEVRRCFCRFEIFPSLKLSIVPTYIDAQIKLGSFTLSVHPFYSINIPYYPCIVYDYICMLMFSKILEPLDNLLLRAYRAAAMHANEGTRRRLAATNQERFVSENIQANVSQFASGLRGNHQTVRYDWRSFM